MSNFSIWETYYLKPLYSKMGTTKSVLCEHKGHRLCDNECSVCAGCLLKGAAAICILLMLFITACGRKKPSLFLDFLDEEGNYELCGGYDLKEINLADIGIETPGGVCVYGDSLYVCDISNSCIVKLGKDFAREASYGTLGMEEGNFFEPWDITFSGGCFYVLDNGNYLSIVVDAEGIVYVSTDAPDTEEAYIYCWKNGSWKKKVGKIVGYLCAGDESVYFADLFEFQRKKKETIIQSVENMLYCFQNGRLNPLAEICPGYAPVALTYWDNNFYMISAGYGMVHCFS